MNPPAAAADEDAAQPEHPLIDGIWNDDEIVLAEVESAGGGALAERRRPLRSVRVPMRIDLADRIGAARGEQQLIGRVADHDHVLAGTAPRCR